jgi:hypothetical protein
MTFSSIMRVARYLGKGEVVSSILTGSTTKAQQIKSFSERALPFRVRRSSAIRAAAPGSSTMNLLRHLRSG